MHLEASRCPICNSSVPESVDCCTHCNCAILLHPSGEVPFLTNTNRDFVRSTIQQVRQSLLGQPEDGEARYRLGLCDYNLGLLDESIEQIQKAAELMPEKAEIRYELAVILCQKGNPQDALGHLDKAIARDETLSSALVLRGLVHETQGSVGRAVADWQAAFRLGDTIMGREHLEAFIRRHSSTVSMYLDPKSVSGQLATYVRLLGTPDPVDPRPLGKMSMRILDAIWPAKADAMRSMYQARVAQFRQRLDDLVERREAMNEDVLGLSSLCVEAYHRMRQRAAEVQAQRQASTPRRTSSPPALSVDARRAILDRTIGGYSRHGYRVVSRADTAAQLIQPKKFSFWWALFWFLFFGIGILVYIFYYMAKRDKMVYLEIDPRGQVVRR